MVLFTSSRPLDRAENIKAVYDAYPGRKKFIQKGDTAASSPQFSIMVTDELVNTSPGKCIFISHGMGACKTYGLDQPNRYFHCPEVITYATASSEDLVPLVASQCGIPESKVIPLGMPRTDAYFDGVTDDGTYLYAPTFRSGQWIPDWEKIDRNIDGHLLAKPHMVTNTLNAKGEHITEVSNKETSAPYLKKCRTLVTDYSSIMFDAMVLRKPVVLFAKDKEQYLRQRGIYYPYPDMYSDVFCDTEESLCDALPLAKWSDKDEERRLFHAGACDGHSTERVVELIRSLL